MQQSDKIAPSEFLSRALAAGSPERKRLGGVTVCSMAVILFLSIACAQQEDLSCLSASQVRIVRVDDAQKRVFVITNLQQIATAGQARELLQRLDDLLRKCRPAWGEGWSASFFKDVKFAGYKDEPQFQTFVADGSWAEAYVGEYERTSRTMILMPATNEAKKFVADGER